MTEEQHANLAEILKRVQGKWLLTYAYHPKVRQLYRDYYTILAPTTASLK